MWFVFFKSHKKKVATNIDSLSKKFIHDGIQPIYEEKCALRGIAMAEFEKHVNCENKN